MIQRGESDASGDFEREVDEWTEHLWPDLMQSLGLPVTAVHGQKRSALSVQFVQGAAAVPLTETYRAVTGHIVFNRNLQHEGSGRITQHIEICSRGERNTAKAIIWGCFRSIQRHWFSEYFEDSN